MQLNPPSIRPVYSGLVPRHICLGGADVNLRLLLVASLPGTTTI